MPTNALHFLDSCVHHKYCNMHGRKCIRTNPQGSWCSVLPIYFVDGCNHVINHSREGQVSQHQRSSPCHCPLLRNLHLHPSHRIGQSTEIHVLRHGYDVCIFHPPHVLDNFSLPRHSMGTVHGPLKLGVSSMHALLHANTSVERARDKLLRFAVNNIQCTHKIQNKKTCIA